MKEKNEVGIENAALVRRLRNKTIIWHPAAFDSGDAAFQDLLIDDELREDDVLHVYTEERIMTIGEDFPEIWKKGVHSVLCSDSVMDHYEIVQLRKVCALEGFTSDLVMKTDCSKAKMNHVYSAKVKCSFKDGRTVERNVLLATAESVEFALKIFLRNGIKVKAIFSCGYHVGFNGCLVEGGVLLRLLNSLGVEWLYADHCTLTPQSADNERLVLDAYPELRKYFSESECVDKDVWCSVLGLEIRKLRCESQSM